MGVVADGVQTTDDATHRRTGDDIHGDARLLQHLQHTDMCHTLRTAAAQYDADLLPIFFALCIMHCALSTIHFALCTHRAAHHRSHQYQYYLLHPLNQCNPLLLFIFYLFTFSPFHLYLWYFLLNSNGVMPACSLKYLPKNDALGKFRSLAISCIEVVGDLLHRHVRIAQTVLNGLQRKETYGLAWPTAHRLLEQG